jgi:hypothetical protein
LNGTGWHSTQRFQGVSTDQHNLSTRVKSVLNSYWLLWQEEVGFGPRGIHIILLKNNPVLLCGEPFHIAILPSFGKKNNKKFII